MIWQCTEILAVIVECMIVTRMLIQYFKFRSDNCRILKWLLLFSLLSSMSRLSLFFKRYKRTYSNTSWKDLFTFPMIDSLKVKNKL